MQLTVLYDPFCGMCNRAKDWLAGEPKHVDLCFLAAGSPEALARFPQLSTQETLQELHVVADDGRLWRGARAWLMCLWAVERTRGLSLRLATPAGLALAQRLVSRLSEGRYSLSRILRWETSG